MKLISTLQGMVRPRTVVLLVILVLTAMGLYFYSQWSSARFSSIADAYMELARSNDIAAFVPGMEQNSIRENINAILVEALLDSTSDGARLKRVREGLELLEDSEQQIDRIGEIGETVAVEIAKMDLAANSASDLTKKGTMRELVALAKRRSEIVQDIRGLSYRANFETGKIFDRIIADGGALTRQHILELNSELPAVEEQFNQRTNLYTELESIGRKIEDLYAGL